MDCSISDEECLGRVEPHDMADGPIPLCEFHVRVLCNELGEDGFREWYSIDLEGTRD